MRAYEIWKIYFFVPNEESKQFRLFAENFEASNEVTKIVANHLKGVCMRLRVCASVCMCECVYLSDCWEYAMRKSGQLCVWMGIQKWKKSAFALYECMDVCVCACVWAFDLFSVRAACIVCVCVRICGAFWVQWTLLLKFLGHKQHTQTHTHTYNLFCRYGNAGIMIMKKKSTEQ